MHAFYQKPKTISRTCRGTSGCMRGIAFLAAFYFLPTRPWRVFSLDGLIELGDSVK